MGIWEFIGARLDEREQVAVAAGGGWPVSSPAGAWRTEGPAWGKVSDGLGNAVAYDEGRPTETQAEHIALNDPNDTLVWVAAMRRVLARHSAGADGYCVGCGTLEITGYPAAGTLAACPELQDLAVIWMHHPDYIADWTPQAAYVPDPGIDDLVAALDNMKARRRT